VCTNGLRPRKNCHPAAARGAGNRLELEVQALIKSVQWDLPKVASPTKILLVPTKMPKLAFLAAITLSVGGSVWLLGVGIEWLIVKL
jgi:hypothetical protein